MTLYEEYISGEYEAAWSKIVRHADFRDDSEISVQAELVAQEMMKRVGHNVQVVFHRLKELGFKFDRPVTPNGATPDTVINRDGTVFEYYWLAYSPPHKDAASHISQVEAVVGRLPASLRAWYHNVGDVCFMGDHPSLCNYQDSLRGREPEARIYCDPLVVYPLYYALAEYRILPELERQKFLFPIAPDQEFKHGQLGTGWDGIDVPATGPDSRYSATGELFVEYLRRSFRCGCFPGWKNQVKMPTDELAYLQNGLLQF